MRLIQRANGSLGRPRPDRLVGETQHLARGQHGQTAVRQKSGPVIVADPTGTLQPAMGREIKRDVRIAHSRRGHRGYVISPGR